MNTIQYAVEQLGGYEATGRICGVSGKAVMKWAKNGRLPRTEWTGETDYAHRIVAALPEPPEGEEPLTVENLCPPPKPHAAA